MNSIKYPDVSFWCCLFLLSLCWLVHRFPFQFYPRSWYKRTLKAKTRNHLKPVNKECPNLVLNGRSPETFSCLPGFMLDIIKNTELPFHVLQFHRFLLIILLCGTSVLTEKVNSEGFSIEEEPELMLESELSWFLADSFFSTEMEPNMCYISTWSKVLLKSQIPKWDRF